MASHSMMNRETFQHLLRSDPMRRVRMLFDSLLGHPTWWVCCKSGEVVRTNGHFVKDSYDLWHDPRVRSVSFANLIGQHLKKRSGEKKSFFFYDHQGMTHFCLPLIIDDKVFGFVGVSGLRRGLAPETINLLSQHVQLVVSHFAYVEEVNRLSATIRPRAVALSTVHTVHRIINSTLNMDELVSRLTHLTAQVVKANRCAIYLVDENSKKTSKPFIVCRAMVGYPKHADKNIRMSFGSGTEGKVAKKASIILRKKLICIPLIDEDVVGVMTVSHKKDKKGFTYFDQEILTTLAEEAVIAIKNSQLYEEQKKVTLSTIQSLAVILGTRIPNSAKSVEVCLPIALKIAEELKLSEQDIQALHYATLLKDTAKIGIPDEILKKSTKLTGREMKLLKGHTIEGAKMVQSFETLKPVVPIILYSREKFDGTGYPKGLKGEKIPIGARILATINAFEAIVMGRPYRNKASFQEAIEEISRNSGTQFDPRIVEIFVKVSKDKSVQNLFNKSR